MGAWDIGNWDNDDALDWVPDLQDGGVDAIRSALVEVSGTSGTGGCCRALAAAEVVAAAFGQALPGLPEEVESWVVASGSQVASDLVVLAVEAVQQIDNDSELQRLFDEAGRDESWHAVTGGLLTRLAAIAAR